MTTVQHADARDAPAPAKAGEAGSSVRSTGHYPIERREGEIERLQMQAAAIAFDAGVMLERIGVAPGWRCLDLGCGPGGIVELLSARAGPTGRVVGLDADPVFLEHARERGLDNVAFVRGDVYRTGLARGSFDFVHVRFVASTAGRPQDLIREAVALACPGGIVALQEPDISTLKCYPPHAAWDRLAQVLDQVFVCAGNDVRLAQQLYRLVRRAGLEDVQYRPFLVGFRAGDRMADFLPATVESVRRTILRHDLIDEAELDAALAACRRHLADPDTVSTYVTVAQVWGRRPRSLNTP
ncbi:MAG: class I SAM-dependent methyltransferase [Burkholderiales bacterium]